MTARKTDQSGILPPLNASYGFQYFRDNISDRLKNSLNNEMLAGPFSAGKEKRSLQDRNIIDVRPRRDAEVKRSARTTFEDPIS